MQLRVHEGFLQGNIWRNKGELVEESGKRAEALIKSGKAHPHVPPIEQATRDNRQAERATAPRAR